MPVGRTWESFRYEVRERFDGNVTDELVTDDPDERDRMVRGIVDNGYEVDVIDRRAQRAL